MNSAPLSRGEKVRVVKGPLTGLVGELVMVDGRSKIAVRLNMLKFDQELSALIFSMISKIEVALRVRLVEALLIHGEPLVLQDSSIFKEKKRYWQNMACLLYTSRCV